MSSAGLPSRSLLLAGRGRQLRATLGTYLGVGGVLLGLIVYLSLTQPQFLTSANFVNILQTNAALLIIAVGLTFVVLLGAIDLSLGGWSRYL